MDKVWKGKVDKISSLTHKVQKNKNFNCLNAGFEIGQNYMAYATYSNQKPYFIYDLNMGMCGRTRKVVSPWKQYIDTQWHYLRTGNYILAWKNLFTLPKSDAEILGKHKLQNNRKVGHQLKQDIATIFDAKYSELNFPILKYLSTATLVQGFH